MVNYSLYVAQVEFSYCRISNLPNLYSRYAESIFSNLKVPINSCMRLHEMNVIGSAVRVNEIPKEYRNLKLLGRGATSLAFEKDPKTVILFTRDLLKKDWLTHGLHMVSGSREVVPVRSHHIRGMQEFPLYALEMPKLYPLNTENRKKVTQELKQWATIYNNAMRTSVEKNNKINGYKLINALINDYEENYPDSIIAPLIQFLSNYDPDQYQFDLGKRQFKQTYDGNIVLLDPVIDKELWNLFNIHRQDKNKSQWAYY